MKQLWQRLEKWLSINAPHLLQTLGSNISGDAFIKTEQQLGITFPQEFKQFYSLHNGQLQPCEGIINGQVLLSLERIVDEWKTWNSLLIGKSFQTETGELFTSDPDPAIKNDWWNPKWIPVTSNYSGDHVCIDFDPSPKGISAQIITMWHDAGWRELLSDTFKNWIITYVDELENGKFIYVENLGIIDKQYV